MVTGVLTRDRILAALEAETQCCVLPTETTDDSQGCTVELVIGAAATEKGDSA